MLVTGREGVQMTLGLPLLLWVSSLFELLAQPQALVRVGRRVAGRGFWKMNEKTFLRTCRAFTAFWG